jgi:hypothetical protein
VKIQFNIAALGRTKWHEYVLRFAFGGAVTACAGLVAKRWGPEVGGLFLAFPAIFPASATLVDKHEKQKKQRTGKSKTLRAREITGVDAAGTAMGTVGLAAFAIVVWRMIPEHSLLLVLSLATFAWAFVAFMTREAHETLWRRLRVKWFHRTRHAAPFGVPQEAPKNKKVR